MEDVVSSQNSIVGTQKNEQESNATFSDPNLFKKGQLATKMSLKNCFKKKVPLQVASSKPILQIQKPPEEEPVRRKVKTFREKCIYETSSDQVLNIKSIKGRKNLVMIVSNTKGDYPLHLKLLNIRTSKTIIKRPFLGSKLLNSLNM